MFLKLRSSLLKAWIDRRPSRDGDGITISLERGARQDVEGGLNEGQSRGQRPRGNQKNFGSTE